MKESFEMPHLDKAVGEKAEHQKDFEMWLTDRFFNTTENIKKLEKEKTPRDLEIIDFANETLSSYLLEYGREKDINIPLEKIHILVKGGVKKYTDGHQREAAASSVGRSIIIDRSDSDIEFALKIFHELMHLKSYSALQVTIKDRDLECYRGGFSVLTRDGKTQYFDNFEEAIISIFTERFYKEKVMTSELFKDEIAKQKKSPYISKQEEVEELNELVDKLWELNKDQFNTRKEVIDLFINAQINGSLLPVARLIEKTFGRGSFRKLGIPNR